MDDESFRSTTILMKQNAYQREKNRRDQVQQRKLSTATLIPTSFHNVTFTMVHSYHGFFFLLQVPGSLEMGLSSPKLDGMVVRLT